MIIQDDKSFKNIGLAVAGGAAATAVHAALLPNEVKASIKNTMFGHDHFIKNAQKSVQKTMVKTGKVFNVQNIMKNAETMYPEFQRVAKNAGKKLVDTFAVTAGVILAVKATQSAVERIKGLKNQEQ